MLKLLSTFSLPVSIIGSGISVLYRFCLAKSSEIDEANRITKTWCNQLLTSCKQELTHIVFNSTKGKLEKTAKIKRQLFTIGELILVGFDKDDDKVF